MTVPPTPDTPRRLTPCDARRVLAAVDAYVDAAVDLAKTEVWNVVDGPDLDGQGEGELARHRTRRLVAEARFVVLLEELTAPDLPPEL